MGQKSTITLRQAYDRGKASQRTSVDWDVALARFSRKYCQPHSPNHMCDLEQSWADGFDDGNSNTSARRPAADATVWVERDPV